MAKSSLLLIALAPCLSLLMASCTSDSQPPPLQPQSGDVRWAIRILAGPEHKLFGFSPQVTRPTTAQSASTPPSAKGVGTRDIRVIKDPGFFQTQPEQDLLAGAAFTCGNTDNYTNDTWQSGAWYVFRTPPNSCDALLRDEQTLLCMADKLLEVADAVNTVTWDMTAPPVQGIPIPWVIPPQAEQDRFIARDLALSVLAHITQLDASKLTDASPFNPALDDDRSTCSALYAKAIAEPSWGVANATRLFGTTSTGALDPKTNTNAAITTTGMPFLGDARLAYETHILRAAGRLLHDALQDSVYADLAGAAERAGLQSDPRRANAEVWGDGERRRAAVHPKISSSVSSMIAARRTRRGSARCFKVYLGLAPSRDRRLRHDAPKDDHRV